MPGIEEIADELYGLPPDEFTAARNQYEKAAKAAGDRDSAALIHRFAKPSVTAWLANQMIRQHRAELEPVLALGAALREATNSLDGEQLRELSRQQQKLMHALVQQARALARAAGRNVSEDAVRGFEDTVRAALADEEAAQLLLAGHLTDALHTTDFGSGFGSDVGGDNVIPLRPRPGTFVPRPESAGPERPPRDEQRQLAEHAFAEAGRALAAATAAFEEAQAQVADADRAAVAARERIEELRQQLEDASSAASDADRHRRDQAAAVEQAARAVRAAERKKQDAQDRRDRLAKAD